LTSKEAKIILLDSLKNYPMKEDNKENQQSKAESESSAKVSPEKGKIKEVKSPNSDTAKGGTRAG
jgi:hypothetical protein